MSPTHLARLLAMVLAASALGGGVPAQGAAPGETFGAVTTMGDSTAFPCGGAPASCHITLTVQALVPAHRAVTGAIAPRSGVITSWSFRHGEVLDPGFNPMTLTAFTARLRVIRGSAGAGVGVGTGPAESVPQAPGTSTFLARLPVQGGDRIGLDLDYAPGNALVFTGATGSDGDLVGISLAWPDGSTPTVYTDSDAQLPGGAHAFLTLDATVEPDQDADGFGDLTQDGCPNDATTTGACVDRVPPTTTITKHPKRTTTSRKAAFEFTSSESPATYECSLKGPGLKPATKRFSSCKAKRVYRNLAAGRFTFKVRAGDAAGNLDPSPASFVFTVRRG